MNALQSFWQNKGIEFVVEGLRFTGIVPVKHAKRFRQFLQNKGIKCGKESNSNKSIWMKEEWLTEEFIEAYNTWNSGYCDTSMNHHQEPIMFYIDYIETYLLAKLIEKCKLLLGEDHKLLKLSKVLFASISNDTGPAYILKEEFEEVVSLIEKANLFLNDDEDGDYLFALKDMLLEQINK